MLKPERSSPHRPPTIIIILNYKLSGVSIKSITCKHNNNKVRNYAYIFIPNIHAYWIPGRPCKKYILVLVTPNIVIIEK